MLVYFCHNVVFGVSGFLLLLLGLLVDELAMVVVVVSLVVLIGLH